MSKSTSRIPVLELSGEEEPKSKCVLLEGSIKKRSTLYLYRQRFLELSTLDGKPRLIYYQGAKGSKLRNEIHLTTSTIAVQTAKGKFEIQS